jgi:hypothetical protein
MTTPKRSDRTQGKKRPGKAKKPRPIVAPSWIRPEVTRRRVGRPAKLCRVLIAEFVKHLRTGLHLANCAALVGVSPAMYTAWLRDGRADEEKGVQSIHREFSAAVRETLAGLHRQGLTTLTVYQRMAEGWDPHCASCARKRAPCGKHPKQIKLAADLQRWILSHRFPREWSPGSVPALLAGDADAGSVSVTTPAGEPTSAPTAFGALVFLPLRPRDDVE